MNTPSIMDSSRLGFHYFPDSLHYRESDLSTWLPRLHSVGARWLTLIAPEERAIPESFIEGLVAAGVQPILHFPLSLDKPVNAYSLNLLFENYARWGVRYVALFDRPNLSTAWTPSAWAQPALVERFLDIYLPLAESARRLGLIPVFPPLEPGGDFWDLAFLRASLKGIQRRGYNDLIECMALGAYAWAGNRPLDWGAGGPESWPRTRPYQALPGTQDQRGFHIFDWYDAIANAEVGRSLPILLLKAGSQVGDQQDPAYPPVTAELQAERSVAMVEKILARDAKGENRRAPALPEALLACNFWVLAATAGSESAVHAWFDGDGNPMPVVESLAQRLAGFSAAPAPDGGRGDPAENIQEQPAQVEAKNGPPPPHPIAHYLLMPLYEWGVSDWQLESVRPFVRKYRPTLGFSLDEARMARRITVAGGALAFSDEDLSRLRKAGSLVERLAPDGTLVAS